MSRRLILAVAILLARATPAAAHAFLDHANPAVGSVVHEAPSEARLWFTAGIELAFSTIQVRDAGGRTVDKGDKQIDPTDHTLLKVSLLPLQPGTYIVIWRVVSVDTHVTNGDFNFTVAP